MSTKYGRYTNFVSINWLKQNVRFQYEVTSNVQRVCIVPYCFLVQFMQHFIMHKIPPKTVSRGACFQNSPTPSASFLCVEINMVLKFLVFYDTRRVPGRCQGKMTQGTYLQILYNVTSKYTIHGSKPILLVFWDLWVKGPYTRPLPHPPPPPPFCLKGREPPNICRYQSEMGIRNCNKSHWVSHWVSKLIIMVIKKIKYPIWYTCDYQKIKYSIIIYDRSSQIFFPKKVK
jgi:hypothetical protein